MLPRFVSQGTYGCIYRPGLRCNGKPYNKDNMITKVQRNLTVSVKEEQVSALVVKIPHFSKYFAPILMPPCQVELASIQEDEIEKCDFIKKKTDTKWKINTLRYVGKQTLIDRIFYIYSKQNRDFLVKFIETHLHLLNGFSRLFKAGIIHNDIKDNNIICDSNGTPIIIDFGLSIMLKPPTKENCRELFFNYDPDYYPWVIDFQVAAYGTNRLPPMDNWFTSLVTSDQINKIITDIVQLNAGLQSFFTESERRQYETTMRTFFTKYVDGQWGTMIKELTTFSKSWDNYSLAMTYLCLIYDLKMDQGVSSSIPKLAEYIQVLKQIILVAPDKRPTCNETIMTLKIMFRKITLKQRQQIHQYIVKMSMDKEHVVKVKQNLLNSRLTLLKLKQKQAQ